MHIKQALRAVALVEAAKGLIALGAGLGLTALLHSDVQGMAEQLVERLHLNPAKEVPGVFLSFAAELTDSRLSLLAGCAALYALIRFIEAFGLWHGKRWAEWFAAATGGIYIPFELYELFKGHAGLALMALIVNLLVVGIAVAALLPHSRRILKMRSRHPIESDT